MAFGSVSSTNSSANNWRQVNDMQREINAQSSIKIFKDDTGTRRVLLGKGADGFYGLKVSKEGQDVFTASDDMLVFNSGQNVFKIVGDPISVNITAPANTTNSTTIPHGLTYTPAIIAYLEAGIAVNARTPLPTWTTLVRDDINAEVKFRTWINAEVDDTNVYIRFFNSTAGTVGPITVTYYLLQESAS